MKKNFIVLFLVLTFCTNNSNYSNDSQTNWCIAKADVISSYLEENYIYDNGYSIFNKLRWKNDPPEDVLLSLNYYNSAIDIYKTTILQERFQDDEILSLFKPKFYTNSQIFFNGDMNKMNENNKLFHEETNYSVQVFTPLVDGNRVSIEATYSEKAPFGDNWGRKTYLAFFSYQLKKGNANTLEICKIWEELSY